MCLDKGQLTKLGGDKIVYKWVVSDEKGIHPVYVPNYGYYNKKEVNIADINYWQEPDYTVVNNHKVVANKSTFNGGFIVSAGVFHSFETYKDAMENCPAPILLYPFNDTKRYSLWKCIIPKDSSVVYKGIYNTIYPAYASSHLKFIEEINLDNCNY